MRRHAGVWIDHRKAVIVMLEGDKQNIQTIASGAQKPSRGSGGAHQKVPYGHQDVVAEDKRDRVYREELDRFYTEVAKEVAHASDLYLFGPGEAHRQLHNLLVDKELFPGRIRAASQAGAMSDAEIVQHVRKFFHK